MPIWKIAPVSDAPEVTLSHWQIRELPNRNRHFVGSDVTDGTGRVSTFIVEFDVETMRGRTNSRRVYHLRGKTGWSGNGEYIWSRWAPPNNATEFVDVSNSIVT